MDQKFFSYCQRCKTKIFNPNNDKTHFYCGAKLRPLKETEVKA